MSFDLDAIRHYRLPTAEEEIAAAEIAELRKVLKSWMAFKTELELAADFRPIETYSAEKLVAHIWRQCGPVTGDRTDESQE